MVVQFNTGKNVKHIIAILLLSSFLSVSIAAEGKKYIPQVENGETVNPDLVIIIPEAGESDNPTESTISKLPSEVCTKLAQQLKSLSVVEKQSDVKMFKLRRAMDELHEKGIDPMLVYSGIDPEALNQNLNLFWQMSVQHDMFQRERHKAYDAIEVAYEKMVTGCNYTPKGDS